MISKCRVCSTPIKKISFNHKVLSHQVNFFECVNCGFVQTEEPYWLEEAYQSVINDCDTGIMFRNQINVGAVLSTKLFVSKTSDVVVDCAGGYGVLVRLLRDKGINALWSDPFCKNLFAVGLEYSNEKADLVTAFEAFEHFKEPILEAERLFEISPNVLLSTELIKKPVPKPSEWWYYGFNHGQHVSFYRESTFEYIAKKFNKHFVTDGRRYHFFSEKPLNKILWKTALKVSLIYPSLFRLGRKSKIWQDFNHLSQPST